MEFVESNKRKKEPDGSPPHVNKRPDLNKPGIKAVEVKLLNFYFTPLIASPHVHVGFIYFHSVPG
jgi:hypothetical protein